MVNIVGVRFKKASKVYDFDSNGLELCPGDMVIVEVERGLGMGTVVYTPKEVDPVSVVRQLKKVVRKADAVDLERHGFNLEREKEAFDICKEKILRYKLPMKLIRVEYLFDSSKAIFYFTSETRVDFRELVKDLASGFHTRIEMRQVGVRDEAKMIGGLGPCGRELCCAGFLSDFEPVTIKMAKEQNLALNPVKISGICGRLMCCLSYEHEMYKNDKSQRPQRPQRKQAGDKDAGCGGCPSHGKGHHAPAGTQEQCGAGSAEGERQGARSQRQGEKKPDGGRRGDRPEGATGGQQGAKKAEGGTQGPGKSDRPEGSQGPRSRGSRKRRGRSKPGGQDGGPRKERS